MPQFNTLFWLSQIFWLLVSFSGLYLGIRFIVFPLFDSIFAKRKKLIDTPLDQAEKLTKKIQALQEELEQKKENLRKCHEEKLNKAYQSGFDQLQLTLQKKEKDVSNHLKKITQKAEHDETVVLKSRSDFLTKALKGET